MGYLVASTTFSLPVRAMPSLGRGQAQPSCSSLLNRTPKPMNIYIDGDVSKGYADFCVMSEEGEILLEIQLDDTRRWHSRMSELIRECNRKVGEEEELEIALEATGGLELNWLHLFRELDETGEVDLNVYRFNPLVIRRFTEQQLHSNKTDEISARALADYLRLGLAEKKVAYTGEDPSGGLRTLARKTQRMVNQSVDLQNELQALLQRAHPELVQPDPRRSPRSRMSQRRRPKASSRPLGPQ